MKQAPRAWYTILDHYLQQQGFKKGVAGSNLYIKTDEDKLLVTLVYVDDLIFASNNDEMSHEFAQNMSKEFEMLMIGESLPWTTSISNHGKHVHISSQIS